MLLGMGAAALMLCLPGLAQAATLAVPTQYSTVQAAINAAQSGDTVVLAAGTYTGPGNVDLDFGGKNITVTSQSGPASTIINCGGAASSDGSGDHRGFYLHSGETSAVISGLTIENGYVSSGAGLGGAVALSGVGATVQNCVLENSTARSGGGLYVTNSTSAAAAILGCTFSGNTADGNGGGAYGGSSSGPITLSLCTFTGNSSTNGDGGGLYVSEIGSGVITVSSSTLSGNTSTHSDGGGIFSNNSGSGSITVTGCALTGNAAGSTLNGGGIYNNNAGTGTLAVTNCTLDRQRSGRRRRHFQLQPKRCPNHGGKLHPHRKYRRNFARRRRRHRQLQLRHDIACQQHCVRRQRRRDHRLPVHRVKWSADHKRRRVLFRCAGRLPRRRQH